MADQRSSPRRHRRYRSLPEDTGAEILEGTVTIAFGDLVDSTGIVQALGDVEYSRLIRRLDDAVYDLATPLRGYVPRREGDGWMVVFGSARRALNWAMAVLEAVAQIDAVVAEHAVEMRIGLHTGEAVQDGRDFLGVHVNMAARVGAVAPGGAICVSAVTERIVRGAPDLVLTDPQLYTMQGFEEPVMVYTLSLPVESDGNRPRTRHLRQSWAD